MNKRLVAILCCLSVALTSVTGCNNSGEPEETSAPPQVTTTTSSEPEETQPSIDKIEWTGAQFDNPVDQAKFDTLLSRVRSNLEANGIIIISDDFLNPPDDEDDIRIVYDPFNPDKSEESEDEETAGGITADEDDTDGEEEEEEYTIDDFILTYAYMNEVLDRIEEEMLATCEEEGAVYALSFVGKAGDENALAFCEAFPDEALDSAKESITKYMESLRGRCNIMYAALKEFGDEDEFEGEMGVAWLAYMLSTAMTLESVTGLDVSDLESAVPEELFALLLTSGMISSMLDKELTSDVMRCAYAFNDTQWYHHNLVADIASEGANIAYFLETVGTVADHNLVSDIGDWLIAPDTPAALFQTGFNEKAEEWGVHDASLNKVFMGGVTAKLPSAVVNDKSFTEGDDGYSTYSFRSTMEEELVLTSFVNYLYQSGDANLPELTKWLRSNYNNLTKKIDELIDREYHPENYPDEDEDGEELDEDAEDTDEEEEETEEELVNPFEEVEEEIEWVETHLDEDGKSIVVTKLCEWLKEVMPKNAYKELLKWIAVDEMDYQSLREVLANSTANIGTYGFVNSLGVSGSIVRNKELVNSYNWQLGFAIGSKMLTETQLKNIVLTYVIYVGAFTDETYTRALDIALSGIVNQTANSDYAMHLEYLDNAAILFIDKA